MNVICVGGGVRYTQHMLNNSLHTHSLLSLFSPQLRTGSPEEVNRQEYIVTVKKFLVTSHQLVNHNIYLQL